MGGERARTHHVIDDNEEVLRRVGVGVGLGGTRVPAPDGAHARVEARGETARRGDEGGAAGVVGVESPAGLRPRLDHKTQIVGVATASLEGRGGGPPFGGEGEGGGMELGLCGGETRRVSCLPFAEEVKAAWEKAGGPEADVGVDVFGPVRFSVFGELCWW